MHSRDMIETKFKEVYGGEPSLVCFAPGRVNLIGEHTDYNGGHVFPCALELGISCAVRAREDRVLRFYSTDIPHVGIVETTLDALSPLTRREWTAYPEGVIYTMLEAGYPIAHGADLLFGGDIPSGMGLSSSAALEVATAEAISELFGLNIPPTELALIGQRAENNYVGMNCGIMDQFASAMGRKGCGIFLDTATLEFICAPIEMEEHELVVVDSRVKHSLAGSAYNDRRHECEAALKILAPLTGKDALCHITPEEFEAHKDAIADPVCKKRAKHAVYEDDRTVRALRALEGGDMELFGRLMNESHISLRDDYEVSCEELDILTEIAWNTPGVLGARMTGGGFGGCMIALVEKNAVSRFIDAIRAGYLERTGLMARFIVAEPGDGVRLV